MISRVLASLASAFLLSSCAAQTAQTGTAQALAAAPGVVSAADPRAGGGGREILRAGGSAADAAIATAIALTVVEPQSSGIGGGGFLVHHDGRSRALTSFDGREEAPSRQAPDWFLDASGKPIDDPSVGGRATGVPGNIRCSRLRMPSMAIALGELFDPAIRLARAVTD
jgi:gamma-glutamyltranspeptidase/glutathione hydrolase